MKIPVCLPIVAALFCATVLHAQDSEKPRPEMREKMEQVRQQIQELNAAGKHEEAEQLARRVREEMGKSGEQPERMRHVAEAIKHLRAAGMNEAAEHIEQMVRGQQKAEGGGHEQAGGREGTEQVQRAMREMQEQVQKAFKDTHEQMQKAFKETHEQMAKMARTIEELREQGGKR